jgi:hypothetical protein
MLKKFSATSPASASTAIASPILMGLDAFESVQVIAVLRGGTGGTLDVYIQMSDDQEGTTFVDIMHFTQLADGAAATTKMHSMSRASQSLTQVAVGIGDATTPNVALASGSLLGGEFGAKWRVVFVAGAGTSAGATQTIYVFGSPAKRRV